MVKFDSNQLRSFWDCKSKASRIAVKKNGEWRHFEAQIDKRTKVNGTFHASVCKLHVYNLHA